MLKKEAIEDIKNGKVFLCNLPVQLRGDREVVIAAVNKNGWELAFADKGLRGDKEVVMVAIENNGRSLEFANKELKGDKEVVFAAIHNFAGALEFASDELRGDKDIVMEAVSMRGWVLEFASKELRGDKELIMAAIKNDGEAYYCCLEKMQRDLDVIALTNQVLSQFGKSADNYLCNELVELKKRYSVDTVVLALEIESAEIERASVSSNVVNTGISASLIKRF